MSNCYLDFLFKTNRVNISMIILILLIILIFLIILSFQINYNPYIIVILSIFVSGIFTILLYKQF